MTTKIETLKIKVAELDQKFTMNPNSKTAKALSDARKELSDAEKEYRFSDEGEEQNRKEISIKLQEMVDKLVIKKPTSEIFITKDSELY